MASKNENPGFRVNPDGSITYLTPPTKELREKAEAAATEASRDAVRPAVERERASAQVEVSNADVESALGDGGES